MKSRKVKQEKDEWYDECKNCGKEIKGTSESMVTYNMNIHQQSKECKK